MRQSLGSAIERWIQVETGIASSIVRQQSVAGGSINEALRVWLADGRTFFVKANDQPLPGLFEREAEGLDALTRATSLRVPAVLGHSPPSSSTPAFLILEDIPGGQPAPDFFEHFGRALAELHRQERHQQFGFGADNYLGSTPQTNGWCSTWPTFWRRHRLGPMLRLARGHGQATPELNQLGDRLVDRLEDVLAIDEPPSLLHGDLWGGNYLVDESGAAVLIDPAVYYGHREADLAMTRLFGGFEPAFYRAYEEAWPLQPDAAERQHVYELHHLLNHLILFGSSYLGGCLRLLRCVVT